ncbi:hypothetical protein FACS1894132_00480 [Clostridia bacterium]|nr:hypothetical protein FACS1894132_00480 [Clostridia bacterium]
MRRRLAVLKRLPFFVVIPLIVIIFYLFIKNPHLLGSARAYIMPVMLASLVALRILNAPEKEKEIVIDDETDEGKILRANDYAAKVYNTLLKVYKKYYSIEFGEVLTSEQSKDIAIGNRSLKEYIVKKTKLPESAVWQVSLSDSELHYGFDHNVPMAVALYHFSAIFIGSFPIIPDNEKEKFDGDISKCLDEATKYAMGFYEVESVDGEVSEEDENNNEKEEDENIGMGF